MVLHRSSGTRPRDSLLAGLAPSDRPRRDALRGFEPAPDTEARPVYAPLPPTPTGGALSRVALHDGNGGGPDHPNRLPFEWTLNPYRGCEFACGYCYARYTHGFLGLDDPRDFERRIFGKEDLPRLLARDLERRDVALH